MATIAPIPNSNTSPTAVNNTVSTNPQTTATQGTGTTARGNLSTDNVLSPEQQKALTSLNTNIVTYGLNANSVQTSSSSTAPLTPLSPETASNILNVLMMIMADLGINLRKANMDSRQTELNNQISALQSQVKQMKDAAQKTLSSALTSAIVGIAMGVVSFVAGSMALKTTMGAKTNLNDMKASMKKDPAQSAENQAFAMNKTEIDLQVGIGQGLTQLGNTISTLGNSVASASSAGQKFDADMASALAQQYAAVATQSNATYDQINTLAANAKQLVDTILQTSRTVNDAKASTLQAMTKNMA